jgi:hypothetical protein
LTGATHVPTLKNVSHLLFVTVSGCDSHFAPIDWRGCAASMLELVIQSKNVLAFRIRSK